MVPAWGKIDQLPRCDRLAARHRGSAVSPAVDRSGSGALALKVKIFGGVTRGVTGVGYEDGPDTVEAQPNLN
jgi:hypothetical protein